jgi:hypothetical protein
MWFKRKALYDYKPEDLDLISLTALQKGLMAKLILVNEDIARRDKFLIEASDKLGGNNPHIPAIKEQLVMLGALNLMLDQIMGRMKELDLAATKL